MSPWEEKLLGDIITLQRGFDLPERERNAGDIPIVSSSGITGYHSLPKCTAPGVVTGRYGTLGEVFYIESPYWPLNTTLWVKDFKGNHPRFISFLLKTLNLGHQNAAGAVPGVNRNALHLMPVRIPSIQTQESIASILSAYDDLIENNTRRIRILEQMAQRLYREWFVHFRFPGHEKVRMLKSEMGLIPERWSVLPMGEVVTEIIDYRGKTPKKLGSDWAETGVIALSALNVKQGRLENLDKAKHVDDDLYGRWMKSELDEGDILMTSEAPLGQLYILTEKKKYCLSQRLFSIRANPKRIFPALLYMFLSSPAGQEQLTIRSSGTTVLGIRQSELRRVPVPIPEERIQQMLNQFVWPLLTQIEALSRKTENLRKTRDMLLPKLVSGEVSVE